MAEAVNESTDSSLKYSRDRIMDELNENGYCVIPDVVPAEECDQYVAEYKNWLSQFDDDSWPSQMHSIIHSYRIGHFDTTWRARLKTRKVFEEIWQTKKLLTSVDGVAISPPPEEGSNAYAANSCWLHIDQSGARKGLHVYQGALYLESTSETDYCFRVMKGSNRHCDEFYETHENANRKGRRIDFYKLTSEQVSWFKARDCDVIKVPVPKGGVVIWDSRTVHDNVRPEYGRPSKDRWRCVVFTCMGPAKWASPRDMTVKRKAYNQLLMTSHWPCQDVRVFESRCFSLKKVENIPDKIPEVACSDDVRRLCGNKEYDFEDEESNGPEWEPEWRP